MAAAPSELFAMVAVLAARAQALGPLAGAPLAAAGLAALIAGTRSRRALAIPGLAAVGAMVALALHAPIAVHLGVSPRAAALALAAAGALAGALVPAAFPFAAAALPAALAGSELPLAGRAELGAAAGALVGGLLGLLFARVVSAAAASFAGGLALAVGLLASFHRHPLARELAGRPAALAGFALVAGIAGAALQLSGAPTSRGASAARSPVSPP